MCQALLKHSECMNLLDSRYISLREVLLLLLLLLSLSLSIIIPILQMSTFTDSAHPGAPHGVRWVRLTPSWSWGPGCRSRTAETPGIAFLKRGILAEGREGVKEGVGTPPCCELAAPQSKRSPSACTHVRRSSPGNLAASQCCFFSPGRRRPK